MKHLFNDISREEKQRILEMHGAKKPLILEQSLSYGSFPVGSNHNLKLRYDSSGRVFKLNVISNHGRSFMGDLFLGGRKVGNREIFHIDGSYIYYIVGSTPVYFELIKSTPTPKKPKLKPKPKPTVKPPQACKNQKGEAFNLFKGSEVNLYSEGADITTEQPVVSQVCIDSIMPYNSDVLKTSSTPKELSMMSGKNGFVLFTNKRDGNTGESMKLFFTCGTKSLQNLNLQNLVVVIKKIATAMGQEPLDVNVQNLTQVNVIAALEKMCSTNPGGLKVPKVQNNAFSSTGGVTNSDDV
jgi:hypothetical protein